MNRSVPLLEAWDFGYGNPAVLWSQFTPDGGWNILGELKAKDKFLDEFAPIALQLRSAWFPEPAEIWSCCDPAGADKSSQGHRQTAVEILRDFGVSARWVTGSNHPERRDFAIQSIGSYMTRLVGGHAALQVHPERCPITITAFESGYVEDEMVKPLVNVPGFRRPKKDGYFDHLMNCAEYTHLNFGPVRQTRKDQEKDERRRLRESQRDVDPFDLRRKRQTRTGRGGY